MTCDSCDQPATVFLSQKNKDGSIQKMNLCASCAQASQAEDSTGYALAEMLTGIGEESGSQKTSPAAANACPACGFTLAHLKRTGRLGCPECYGTFQKPVAGMLEKMHRASRHQGKHPEQAPISPASLKILEDELASAVEAEDYEKAAAIRDRIRKQSEQKERAAS